MGLFGIYTVSVRAVIVFINRSFFGVHVAWTWSSHCNSIRLCITSMRGGNVYLSKDSKTLPFTEVATSPFFKHQLVEFAHSLYVNISNVDIYILKAYGPFALRSI